MNILSGILLWLYKLFAPPKRDFKVVFFCLAGASMIWLLNALNKNYTTILKCPVRYEYLDSNLMIVSPPPDKIDINVSAGGWNLLRRNILFKRYPLHLELQNPTKTSFLATPNLVPVIAGQLPDLSINQVVTDTLFFDIQKIKEKRITGRVDRHLIHLENSFRTTGPITIDPGEFTVSGPEKLIDTLTEYFEIIIEKDEIKKPFDREIKLELYNSSLVRFTPETVRVRFNVERFIDMELEVPVVPVNFPRDSSLYILNPVIGTNFKIRESMADKVGPSDFLITADYKTVSRKNLIAKIEVKKISNYIEDFRADTTIVKVGYGKKRKTL